MMLKQQPSRMIPPPSTQGLSCSTFQLPVLDGSLNLAELYEWHYEHSPNHRFFVFSNANGEVRTVYWKEVVRAARLGARLVREIMGWKSGMNETPVIAVLATSDTLSYASMLMGIIRAGYTMFAISPRNSAAAVAHLISKTKSKHIFRGNDPAIVSLANAALAIIEAQDSALDRPTVSPIPLFDELYTDSMVIEADDLPYERKGLNDIVAYIHSSGSTAYPKPIPWTQHQFIQLGMTPYFGERDLTDQMLSLHTIPMFHGMGIMQLAWTAASGIVLGVFEPRSPAIVPTPRSHFDAAVATNSDLIFSVPAIIEAWSKDPDCLKWLATRIGVLFGGGPLNKSVGDYLTSQGVSVFNLYGSTECGIVSPIVPVKADYDWEYFRFASNTTAEMVPFGDETFEFVMLPNPYNEVRVVNTQIDGCGAYATSDLFTPHPTKPGYWRIYGRKDDQIMHNTGEKTNPGPLENILNQDPHVQATVMFRRGQFQAGAIIDPKPDFRFDPADEVKLAEFRNKIWPTVQKLNEYAPQHSRLFKEMILVSKPFKPFQYTGKSTARRQVIIDDYEEEIQVAYDAIDSSAQVTIESPSEWGQSECLIFVRAVVNAVLVHGVEDDEDIFQHGCDSLQATWIRNSLLRALRDTAELDTRTMADNFVYDHPTVNNLATFISGIATGSVGGVGVVSKESKVQAMHAMVEKYTLQFPVHSPLPVEQAFVNGTRGDVVLLTGTTGSLGSHLLAQLVSASHVTRVYAINRRRRSGQLSLLEEQRKALDTRGLDAASIFRSKKVVLIEADLAHSRFGVIEDVYDEMIESVTHIIHNAWPVHFNLALASFESSIKGLRNLIDFALSSPHTRSPAILFTSTIGVFQHVSPVDWEPMQELPICAEMAVGSGYSESKWVSEEILLRASRQASCGSLVVRVGQLSGGRNGAWNTTEWFPSLVQASCELRSFPEVNGVVSWIPVHVAAQIFVDFLDHHDTLCEIVHLVHPQPVLWSSIATSASTDLQVPLLPYVKWLAKLESVASQDLDGAIYNKLSALRLLPFFQQASGSAPFSKEAMGLPTLAIDKTKGLSELFGSSSMPTIGQKDVKEWLRYWRSVGFVQDTKHLSRSIQT